MKSNSTEISPTRRKLEITADEASLKKYKNATLKRLQAEVSAPGFRKGKAPLNVVEKQVDDRYLTNQFLDEALTGLYQLALTEHDVRPVDRPEVTVTSFVPFTELKFSVEVDVVPPIKLADYTKIKVKPSTITVDKTDVEEVLSRLRNQAATKHEVKRAAKDGDEAIINFDGTDEKGQRVNGASGKDYPLQLGSKTFIPGFEDEVIGLKAGDEKTFTVTFPADYGVAALQNKPVTFAVTVSKVNEVKLPELNDKFAKDVAQLDTLDELKKDIESQLRGQKEQEATNELRDKVIEEVVTASKLELPASLVNDQVESLLTDFKQNLVYRGITYPEYLQQEGMTEEEHKDKSLKPQAERRVAAGLVLAEIAEKEQLTITPEELEIRIQLMKGQYNNPEILSQFEQPETRRDIMSRLLTEKTVDLLVDLATK